MPFPPQNPGSAVEPGQHLLLPSFIVGSIIIEKSNCLSGIVSQIPRFPQPQGFISKRPFQNSLPKNRTLLSARLGFRVGEIVSVLFWTVLHKSVFWSWIF